MKRILSALLAVLGCVSLFATTLAAEDEDAALNGEVSALPSKEPEAALEEAPAPETAEQPAEEDLPEAEETTEAVEEEPAAAEEAPLPAEEAPDGDGAAVVRGVCGDGVTWTLDPEGTLTVSGQGEIAEYELPQNSVWYNDYRTRIKRIVIEEGVTTVGGYAFAMCSAEEISLPSSLRRVSSFAFYQCASLTSVTVPEGVTFIGAYAFGDCTALTRAVLPDSAVTLQEGVFKDCVSLTEVRLPAGLKYVYDHLFDGCKALSALTLPDSVLEIREYAFANCEALTELSIPAGVTAIHTAAFYRCYGLVRMVLPQGLSRVGDYLFDDCSSLEEVTLPARARLTAASSWRAWICPGRRSVSSAASGAACRFWSSRRPPDWQGFPPSACGRDSSTTPAASLR